jgi:hypothetical protein
MIIMIMIVIFLIMIREFKDFKTQIKYIQKVSPEPASRHDVVKLQVALDERLQARQARENGLLNYCFRYLSEICS